MTRAGPRPVGTITRGTTGSNRLRRFDRWILHRAGAVLRASAMPLVVDLGFGASPATTVELAGRLRRALPPGTALQVVGVEIDPARVALARARLAEHPVPGVDFVLGGFEIPVDGRPVVIRACNVLRQYPEADVPGAWARMGDRLALGGVLVEGTCDELGRRAGWFTLGRGSGSGGAETETLTLSADLARLGRPSDLAQRLPKALIHRNVPGEPVHRLLRDLDDQWDRAAALGSFGPRQRWIAAVAGLRDLGHPVVGGVRRWRLGEVTVAWPPSRVN